MADKAEQPSIPMEGNANGSTSESTATETESQNQNQNPSSANTPVTICASCKTPESDPSKPLKPCTKCQSVSYCSRDCQKNDWKVHKKTCAKAAQIYAQTADLKPAPPPRVPKKEGHRGGLQKWQFDT